MKELFANKRDCCGCELCSQVCPVSIIEMKQDAEGFFYPTVTVPDRCVGCGRCEKVCPMKQRIIPHREFLASYTGFANNEADIKKSASGGVCTILSRLIIDRNGVVYGVSYSDNCQVIRYKRATSIQELESFRGSKYAQARKKDIYNHVMSDLKDNKMVLFIGLPCDVAALYNFTRNDFSNLYTIELVCHGVTSPKVHEQFVLKEARENCSPMLDFSVRYKKKGWKPYFVYEKFENGIEIIKPFERTPYNTAFTYLKRPSCNCCKFKAYDKEYGLQADMTVGDNHGVMPDSISYNKWGSSVLFVHSTKGQELIDCLKDVFAANDETASLNELIRQNLALYKAVPEQKNRSLFLNVFQTKGLESSNRIFRIKCARLKNRIISTLKTPIIYLYVKSGLRNHKTICVRVLGIFIPKYRRARISKP